MRAPAGFAAGLALLVATASLGVAAAPSDAAASGPGAVTITKTITRDHLTGGQDHVVDTRTVTLSVSQTHDLRGRQEIAVSWSGAHPTGGIVADQNSIDAQGEEYPFVLLECRGIDSTTVSAAARLSPKTCWTQSWSERYQDTLQTDFPSYRMDRYATASDRRAVVGAPSRLPSGCYPAPVQHWVPFVAVSGHVYEGGPAGCAGQPPESQSVGGQALPSNETFGVTGLNGRGTADFDVWTEAQNASLGCSPTVPCSLVAIPILGISCDPAATSLPAADQPSADELASVTQDCESRGRLAPGQLMPPGSTGDLPVSGSLWWSASNWRNRISVPLTFAPTSDVCNVVSSANDIQIFGSELLADATQQWAPHFCLNANLFRFTHVQTAEPEARNLVATGTAEAAFTSFAQPQGYGKPVVNAPVALTGWAISYVIDDANGQPYRRLRLNARLLAKLLTESYPSELAVQQEDPHLQANPLNVTLDPEFIKLNPGIRHGVAATEAASALLALSSDSDVTRALTTYINDNPAARAWLNGRPDPWGMVVNPAYADIALPVDRWPLLSTFEPTRYYKSDLNDCLYNSPVPFLPLVAAPVLTLAQSSLDLQFALAQSTTVCSQIDGTSLGEKLVAQGRQTTGYRFMIGVTSLADARRYGLQTAALATSTGYVAPSDASLRSAVKLLQLDASTGTWPIPYQQITNDPAAGAAYPGTMVVYAAVPAEGLPAADARDYASLLRFAAGPGQTPGLNSGQLPPGYLPLTAANGLGALARYTLAAADDVAAQRGASPGTSGAPSSSTPGGSLPITLPGAAPTAGPVIGKIPNAKPVLTPAAETFAQRLGLPLGWSGLALVIVAAIAVLGLLAGVATYGAGRYWVRR